jgi:hypothetical protein
MIKQIKNTSRYFISSEGYCFRTSGLREEIIPIKIISGVPRVKIENSKFNLVLLMIEYFVELKTPIYKISHTITDDRIPVKNIKIKYISKDDELDNINIFRYKCSEKANSNNKRVGYTETLTSNDVLNCLKRSDFRCYYCAEPISSKIWHLEHLIPISKGGLNNHTNIASSCKTCNEMKGALDMKDFLSKCYKIIKHDSKLKGLEIKKAKIN